MFASTYVSNSIATSHVETVCLLSNHNAEQNVNIDLNMDEEELYLSNLKLLLHWHV